MPLDVEKKLRKFQSLLIFLIMSGGTSIMINRSSANSDFMNEFSRISIGNSRQNFFRRIVIVCFLATNFW